MKIAMMVRGYLPAPRPKDIIYAPVDLAIAICQGLVKRGHTVDFYGPLGTEIEGVTVITNNLRPLIHDQPEMREMTSDVERLMHYVPSAWDNYLATTMFKKAQAGEYDLLHFHHPEVGLALANVYKDVPVVYTQHDPVYDWYREMYELFMTPNQHFISISDNQRRDAPDLPYIRTAYNGVDIQHFPFGDNPEDYLLIAGRIVPQKGFKEAVQLAKQTGDRLLIIGPVYPDTQDYFDQYIKPHLNDKILHLGYIEYDQMWRYYQKAKAFLTPVQWEEPFGLTTIEAMACGTPVISLRRGAAPELIVDGKTGFIVDSIAEMAQAVSKVGQINRADCREHVKQMFSLEKMVDAYEAAFTAALQKHKAQTPTLFKRGLVSKKLKEVTLPKIKSVLPTKHRKAKHHRLDADFKRIIQEITEADPEAKTID